MKLKSETRLVLVTIVAETYRKMVERNNNIALDVSLIKVLRQMPEYIKDHIIVTTVDVEDFINSIINNNPR